MLEQDPESGKSLMRSLLLFLAVMLLSGCAESGSEQSHAACELRAFGVEGTAFRRNYAAEHFQPYAKDAAYREFMLTCMEAEHFEFELPLNSDGSLNTHCWLEDAIGAFPDAVVDNTSCYRRDWF